MCSNGMLYDINSAKFVHQFVKILNYFTETKIGTAGNLYKNK